MNKIFTPYLSSQPTVSINTSVLTTNNAHLADHRHKPTPSTHVLQYLKQYARVYSMQAGCDFIAN